MKDSEVKESRQMLRLVQEHLFQAHTKVGATQTQLGLVDVVHHPKSTLPHLNYVTPRRNTAWVPAPEVEKGMKHLKELGRTPRVNYIEGLFPPVFAKSLLALGLKVIEEKPIMVYKLDEENEADKQLPVNITVSPANDQQAIGLWWYIWRNAYYDVITNGIEPIKIGEEMQAITNGQQTDLIMYRDNLPIGVARVTYHESTAHLTTLVIMKEFRKEHLIKAFYKAACAVASVKGSDFIFTSGESATDRKVCREVGFTDVGSMVCYAETADKPSEETHDDNLAQPLFAH